MEGYKYFVDGWVSKVLVHQVRRCSGEGVSKQVTVISASVKHSQRLSDTPLKPCMLKRRGQLYVPIAHAWQALARLAVIPKGKWFCPSCQKTVQKGRKRQQ